MTLAWIDRNAAAIRQAIERDEIIRGQSARVLEALSDSVAVTGVILRYS
jgi:hypothetical protein